MHLYFLPCHMGLIRSNFELDYGHVRVRVCVCVRHDLIWKYYQPKLKVVLRR